MTDAGLVHLKGLKNLRYVYLNDTKVTAAAQELHRALPEASIVYGPPGACRVIEPAGKQ